MALLRVEDLEEEVGNLEMRLETMEPSHTMQSAALVEAWSSA